MNAEAERLHSLTQLEILGTPASESFDRITRLASKIFNLPIAAVSLTDSDRQWFKSRVGVEHWSIPREKAPCSQVAETCDVVIIEDFLADPFYSDSLLAKAGIRFYAGAPLVTRDGFGLGAMCVLGMTPRRIHREELTALRDLAATVMAQIELQHAFGRIDPISELPNRTQFIEDLSDLARDQTPGQRRTAVLVDLIAVDQMNHVVRVMGQAVVDDMVKTAGRLFRHLIGPQQKAYHVGATQLAALTPDGMDEIACSNFLTAQAERLRKLGGPHALGSTVVGIAPFPLGGLPPIDILRIAQGAALDARSMNKSFEIYSQALDTASQRSFILLRDFEAALKNPVELRLVYQPRIDLATGRCVGAEALMRWTHPTLGSISPGEFIPLIERIALATPATAWVLETAISQIARWRNHGIDFVVSVNISSTNLHETDFASRVSQILVRHGVEPEWLELEVTETAVMTDAAQALVQLSKLRAAGIRLAIDDFGTGYSSLAYLQRLPVHVVKIDRAFMMGLDVDPRQLSLVTMMVSMAKHLGYRVVAEGVETQQALKLLRTTGCDEAQGYHFARPMAADELVRWVGRDPIAL
ncbi:GGDEF and EAL domain-containing protein [Methylobacterium sp. J-067]|jgi:EAL domain-containing protein (putative c-di-GMP-specific phosphodiesterase class I)/GGDEF domain-containing protein|uniref:sensor domain-containing phosphodiesterase n=1 Tax=Methylobacterium sp. J-067 TaxID=2836648 RepID=UPI001FB9C251|nr:GGDEF and EAL domain-containing protein [Methylobacterium sp. J-067]MCJ2024492.1 GGDEF and EAL domain-containing protein [Methylobacterium sp. J-067]